MRLLTTLLLACLLLSAALPSPDVAAQEQEILSPEQRLEDRTAEKLETPAWLGRIQKTLADTIVEQLSKREAESGETSRDGGSEARPELTQDDEPAPGADLAPIHPCDRLAGSPDDPYAVVDGVRIGEIDASAAVPACEEAVRQYPETIRFAFQVARAYFVAERYEEAAHWFGVAAEAGNPVAMNNLGVLHRLGRGLPQSYREASFWFLRSADAGSPQGMANLGLLYREGNGVPLDDSKAVRWFHKAANMGEPFAMRMLGEHFAEGRGVPPDDREAARWYLQAARSGDVAAMSDLAPLYSGGIGLPKDEGEAMRWYRAAADLGSASAKFILANRTLKGRGVPQDDAEAVRLYREAAEGNFPPAMAALGRLHRAGRGVAKDLSAAAEWFRRSAEAGNADAIAEFGFMLDSGQGVAADPVAGADWIYESLRGGSYVAHSRLRSGDGSNALRQALRARLRNEGFIDGADDDLMAAIDALFEAAWKR